MAALDPTAPPPARRSRRRRLLGSLALAGVLAGTLSACLNTPGDLSKIVKVSSKDVAGWHYDEYENRAYPCSISGYQTFAIGTKVGSPKTAARPLWVKMRGGGTGYFDDAGTPRPSSGNMVQISLTGLLKYDTPGLMASVKAAPEGFRTLIVSMCSHDVYAGNNTTDPHNPNKAPDGTPRTTNGLLATKAAVQYARTSYPTTKYFLHGTSAGGAGTFHMAWSLQQQGIAPAGIVSDSGIVDQDWELDASAQGTCTTVGEDNSDLHGALLSRIDPDIGAYANQPDLLVARGDLKVPILQVWNRADHNTCGSTPMTCAIRSASTGTVTSHVTLGSSDCHHENLRRAIAAQGATSRSKNLPVCVTNQGEPTCGVHVVTTRANGVNTDPASPVDYQAAILTWVRARLADLAT